VRRGILPGVAGFIGSFTAQRLLDRGDEVVGVDNLNDYYDVSLKHARLARLAPYPAFRFVHADLADQPAMETLFARERFERVAHLGAQAGVRYSLQAPHAYIQSNIVGTLNILEGCRRHAIAHLVYASSSSVYGASSRLPYSVHEPAAHPVSLYAATKRANELMAHSYSSVFGFPTTGLRFFTVYGPWGRPDMALFKFARAILAGEPIEVFNHGHHQRDFTYIDDIVEGVIRVLDRTAQANPAWNGTNPDPASSRAPYRVYNIGSNRPIELLRYIEVLEECLGRKAEKVLLPLQPGDVADT
jgi:UDP-glucuronate 4-epimerase